MAAIGCSSKAALAKQSSGFAGLQPCAWKEGGSLPGPFYRSASGKEKSRRDRLKGGKEGGEKNCHSVAVRAGLFHSRDDNFFLGFFLEEGGGGRAHERQSGVSAIPALESPGTHRSVE